MNIEIESNEQPQEFNNATNNIEAGEDAMESQIQEQKWFKIQNKHDEHTTSKNA